MATDALTVAKVLHQAGLIDRTLDALAKTAPEAIAAMGGREALARTCEMTCIGPIPRINAVAWETMSREYQDKRDGWA